MKRWWWWWVASWDRRESPIVLAVVRIGVALVLLGDFLTVARLGLVVSLMSPEAGGGMGGSNDAPWVAVFGATPASAQALWWVLVVSATLLAAGVFTRTSALVLALASAQWAWILPDGDRAIDVFLRDVLLVLACSGAGATLSADARFTTGRWNGDGREVPAWPRYLLVLQVVLVYFTAGVQKFATQWWPWGGWSALYLILHDWAVSRYHLEWIGRQPFYLSTQVGTGMTVFWQWTYPIVLVHYFPGPGAPSRLRRFVEAARVHLVWLAIGITFHVSIGLTMELGIFPWGFLAVYPAFLHPDELRAPFRWLASPAIHRAAG